MQAAEQGGCAFQIVLDGNWHEVAAFARYEKRPLLRVAVFRVVIGLCGGAYRVSNPEPLVPQTSALPLSYRHHTVMCAKEKG